MSLNLGKITTAPCVNSLPGPDSRCQDPAFALSAPAICAQSPRFFLKPETALVCELGEVAFGAFYVDNGIETDVTAETSFTSSHQDIALIGVSTGRATGVGSGSSTISATFGTLTAQAELTVLLGADCCSDKTVAMMVLVDHTQSMSQTFPGYGKKLDFAKAAAVEFISTVNTEKDLIGLAEFTAAAVGVLSGPVADKTAVAGLVAGILQTQAKTTFYDGMAAAMAALDLVDADLKLLLIISDGEDTTPNGVPDPNPVVLADNFKSAGGIIMGLGVRAHGAGYSFLSALATGGFFLNAFSDTAAASTAYLKNLRGYVCAGNTTPDGDVEENQGQLNYSGLENWWLANQYPVVSDADARTADDAGAYVDLHGNGFFDYLPGNGMYVELMSGGIPVSTHHPHLVTKDAFTLTDGESYQLTFRIAGNQAQTDAQAAVVVKLINAAGDDVVGQTFYLPDYQQGFATYTISWTQNLTLDAKIVIYQQVSDCLPADPTADANCAGVLLDSVKLVGPSGIIFEDDFSGENIVYVPPKCGPGTVFHVVGMDYIGDEFVPAYGYSYGYDCYGDGALDDPPIPQEQDPDPLPNLEVPTTSACIYTSTVSGCARCPTGFTNIGQPLAGTVHGTGEDWEAILRLSAASAIRVWQVTFDLPWTPDDTPDPTPLDSTVVADSDPVTRVTIKLDDGPAPITSFTITFERDFNPPVPPPTTQCLLPDQTSLEGSNDNMDWTQIGGGFFPHGNDGDSETITLPVESQAFLYYRARIISCHGVAGAGSGKVISLSVSGTVSGALTLWGSNNGTTWTAIRSKPRVTGGSAGLVLAYRLPAASASYLYYKASLGQGTSVSTGKAISLEVFAETAEQICVEATSTGGTKQAAAANALTAAISEATGELNCKFVYTQTAVATATCADGSGLVSASATISGFNGDAEALQEAQDAAQAAANAKLDCT